MNDLAVRDCAAEDLLHSDGVNVELARVSGGHGKERSLSDE